MLAAPWLPQLFERRWPARLWQGLGWLLSLVFLGAAVALLVSPKLAAKTAELGSNPWPMALSLGLIGLGLNIALRRQSYNFV